jgi:hypothetical protein
MSNVKVLEEAEELPMNITTTSLNRPILKNGPLHPRVLTRLLLPTYRRQSRRPVSVESS